MENAEDFRRHGHINPRINLEDSYFNSKMAEPQPPIREGVDPTDEAPATAPPASAEDRKAAAALSSLDARATEENEPSAKTRNIDQEALAKAISRLELSQGATKGVEISEKEKEFVERRRKEREERDRRNKVKVSAEDVGLLVQELDMSKGKATDLLKAYEGDAVKAMRAFVRAETTVMRIDYTDWTLVGRQDVYRGNGIQACACVLHGGWND
ncbi:MAG: hypothetical protein Q9170_006374 [Blastenia crenularia]